MAGPKTHGQSNPKAYLEQLRKSYGSLSAPERRFVLEATKRAPYSQVLRELTELGPVEDDTDINCDVCFTLILTQTPPLFIKISMVGPYAAVLAFGHDGLATRGRLVTPDEPHDPKEATQSRKPADPEGSVVPGGAVENVFSILSRHGFSLPSAASLESSVPITFADGIDHASLYAALFEPEGEIPWLGDA